MSFFMVDVDTDGGSLANFVFRGYNPCLVEVSEEYVKCLTNKGTIEFNIMRGELSKIDRRFPIADVSMLPELFNYDYNYFLNNLRFDRAITIFMLEFLFEGFLKGGPKGMSNALYNYSEGRYDYSRSKAGDYSFWFKNKEQWQRANFPALLDVFFELAEEKLPDTFKDKYLWKPSHHGVKLISSVRTVK